MGIKISVHTDGMDDVRRQLALACSKAEHVLAIQVESDTDQFVPARNRVLADGTRVIGNLVVYPGPYARYLYYGKVWIDPKINAAGFLTDEGWFSRKGSRKVPTERDLHISQAVNRKACSHWFEASKAQNLKKWVRVADKAVKDEL